MKTSNIASSLFSSARRWALAAFASFLFLASAPSASGQSASLSSPSNMSETAASLLKDSSTLETRLSERKTQTERLSRELAESKDELKKAKDSAERSEAALTETLSWLDASEKARLSLQTDYESYKKEASEQNRGLEMRLKLWQGATLVVSGVALAELAYIGWSKTKARD